MFLFLIAETYRIASHVRMLTANAHHAPSYVYTVHGVRKRVTTKQLIPMDIETEEDNTKFLFNNLGFGLNAQ